MGNLKVVSEIQGKGKGDVLACDWFPITNQIHLFKQEHKQ